MSGKPKLRPVDAQWKMHEQRPVLLLRDPLGLTDKSLAVPEPIALMITLFDGTRDIDQLRTACQLRHGIVFTVHQLEGLVAQLDDALLLDTPRYVLARADAVAAFRAATFRPPALAGRGYPSDPRVLRDLLDGYVAAAFGEQLPRSNGGDAICGLLSPHIDYQRGGAVYAKAWLPVADAVSAADLVIVLGTDHAGGPGEITLTRQQYATPWGVLPTAQPVVDAICSAIGEEAAFESELHHRYEHSIELALVWLHYVLGDVTVDVLPVLCGSFHHYVHEEADPTKDERRAAFVDTLRREMIGRRTFVVAAADLAHVGPVFGDTSPFGEADCRRLREADAALLNAATSGRPEAFFEPIRQERDRHRICGLPPIYHMLHLLGDASGEITGYLQCPADSEGHSWVSIGGIVYRGRQPAPLLARSAVPCSS